MISTRRTDRILTFSRRSPAMAYFSPVRLSLAPSALCLSLVRRARRWWMITLIIYFSLLFNSLPLSCLPFLVATRRRPSPATSTHQVCPPFYSLRAVRNEALQKLFCESSPSSTGALLWSESSMNLRFSPKKKNSPFFERAKDGCCT